MLKNKWKIVAILAAIILVLMVPTVRAENETPAQNSGDLSVNPISENPEATNTEAPVKEDNFKKGDVYLTGDNITVDYVVDGNLFIFANQVTINSQIGGDVFVVANKVTVGEQGYVFSNLFALSNEIDISGVVYDLYSSSKNVTINGYIYRDIRVMTDTLNVNGIVGRNAFVKANAINFATNANTESTVSNSGIISGDLNYTASKEITIPEGAVAGTSNFTQENKGNSVSIQGYILSLGRFLATVAILWLICLWLTPKFLKNGANLISKKILPIAGYGILTPILALIAFVILLVLGITSNIAILLLAVILLIFAISSAIFVITFNQFICEKFKIQKSLPSFGVLILLAAVTWGLTLIPYVGFILSIIVSLLGLGTIVIGILPSANKEKNKKKSK